MVLSLPDCSVSYIIPFKSGKNLIGTTLSHLFRIHDINHFIREDLSGIQECCNIFVRNPVDRFFSCYSWLQNRLKYDEENRENDKLRNLVSELKINSLDTFVKEYPNFIKNYGDPHFLPQSTYLLEEFTNGYEFTKYKNLESDFAKKFKHSTFNFYRIEDLANKYNVNNGVLYESKLDYTTQNVDSLLKSFDFLSFFDKELTFDFIILYSYYKVYFNQKHHLRWDYSEEATLNNMKQLYKYFLPELEYYGYDTNIKLT